jgi:pimeloyl-ACP methyl ester carboxylesterase
LHNTHTVYGSNSHCGQHVSVNGISIYVEIYGWGEPLLLLHGNLHTIAAFQHQIPFFEQQYRVIVPDCRGRGRSTDNEDELSFHNQALDIKLLLEALQVEKAHIIGWSDGAIIGLLMAMKFPEKVQSLVACGANIRQDETALSAKSLEVLREAHRDNVFNGFEKKLLHLVLFHPNIAFDELKTIQCPVLVVAGDRDEILASHTVQIFESIPGAQLFIVPNATHRLPSELPGVFNEAVLRFMKKILNTKIQPTPHNQTRVG